MFTLLTVSALLAARENVNPIRRTSEFLMDTTVTYVSGPFDQKNPAIAFDGVNYMVVWEDYRNGYGVYGTRVSQSGVVIDKAGFHIAGGTGLELMKPAIAFDGSNYLVVWEDFLDFFPWILEYRIPGRLINQDGTLIGTEFVIASGYPDNPDSPATAFGGSHFLVVWEWSNPAGIYGRFVDHAGNINPTLIAIADVNGWHSMPAVASDGTGYFVVWSDSRGSTYDIYGARVDEAGTLLDTAGISISSAAGNQSIPAVAFDGCNFLVVWDDQRSGNHDIYGARVTPNGQVLEPEGIPICSTISSQSNPSVASDGENYIVVWTDDRNGGNKGVYGARITESGILLDTLGIAISSTVTQSGETTTGFDGINYLVAWDDNSARDYDVCAVRMSTAGLVLDTHETVISHMAYCQFHPSAASVEQEYMVAWGDLRSDSSCDIYGARVDSTGALLDPCCTAICQRPQDQLNPDVVAGDSCYLVVWEDYFYDNPCADIVGARTQGGMVYDTTGIIISAVEGNQKNPAVGFSSHEYFTVWEDWRNGDADIYGARINAEGINLDPAGLPIAVDVLGQYNPDVSFDGRNYMVVYQNEWNTVDSPVEALRIDRAGIVLDTVPIEVTAWGETPAIASDGSSHLVVWGVYSADYYFLYCARIDSSGVLLDTNGILIAECWNSWGPWNPAVEFNGTYYLVTWDWTGYGINGALVSPGGTIDSVFTVAASGERPAIGCSDNGQMLIAYSCWTDSINGHPANTMRIWGKFYPFTGVEETSRSQVLDAAPLLVVHPNPFRRTVTIRFQATSAESKVDLRIYDAGGRLVRIFDRVSTKHLTGIQQSNQVTWDGRDDAGYDLPPGVYFVQVKTGDYSQTEKAILVR